MLARGLTDLEVVLDPLDQVALQHLAIDLAGGDPQFFLGLANQGTAETNRVQIAVLDAEGRVAAQIVLADAALQFGLAAQGQAGIGTSEGAANLVPVVAAVAIAHGRDQADRPLFAQIQSIAAGQAEAAVRSIAAATDVQTAAQQSLADRLDLTGAQSVRGERSARTQKPSGLAQFTQHLGLGPSPIVESGEIASTTVEVEAIGEGGAIDDRAANRNLQERRFRHAYGAQLDGATAELARHFRREGLLHHHALQDAGRKQIQRHHATGRIGAGNLGTVEQHAGIALAESAHEHELAIDQGQPGDPLERTGGIGIASP